MTRIVFLPADAAGRVNRRSTTAAEGKRAGRTAAARREDTDCVRNPCSHVASTSIHIKDGLEVPTQIFDPTPVVIPLLRGLLTRALRAVAKVVRRRKHEIDDVVAQGERLVQLMADAEHLMTLMFAKHHPFATANTVEDEARALVPLMAEIESTAHKVRGFSELSGATDRLLNASIQAAEFSNTLSRWRRVDMVSWRAKSATWAAERIRFRNELDAVSGDRPRRIPMATAH